MSGLPEVPVPEEERVIDFVAILGTLRKRWKLVTGITLVVGLGTTFYTLGQKKIYEASATILFDPNPPRPLGRQVEAVVDMGGSNFWNNREYYETQYALMKSMRLTQAVAEDLGLQHDQAFLQNTPPDGRVIEKDSSPSVEKAALVLRNRMTIKPIKNSRLAQLAYRDADPARSLRITTALAETFVSMNLTDNQMSTSSAVEWLNGQLDKLKDGLDSSELALHEYKLQHKILSTDLDAQSNILREEIQQLSSALTATRIKREELAARHTELAKISSDDPSQLPATEFLQSNVLAALRESYVEAMRQRDGLLSAGKGENHYEVKAAESAVTASRKALVAEIHNIQGAVAKDLAIVRKQEAGLSGLLETAKQKAFDLNLLGIEYNRLSRTKENSEKLYSVVLERSKEGDLARMLQVNNISIAEQPMLPTKAIKPNVPVNIFLGGAGGLLLGLAAALGLQLLDRSVKTQNDLEKLLGLPFLGLIPAMSSSAARRGKYYGYRSRKHAPKPEDVPLNPDLMVHVAPLSGPAEAARAVRTNLRFMAADKPFRVLLVTSANPSEGKTMVACNVAIAMAQAGQKVLIIDADLRRPRLHRVFSKSNDFGLTSVLLDRDTLTEELIHTDIPNLSVLTSGPIPPNPAELLQSETFMSLMAELRQRYDNIVLDSPPVGPVADAVVLTTQVDGTVLVVRAFETPREIVANAKKNLQNVGGRVVGAVLNRVDLSRSEYRGYYRYRYYRKDGYYRDPPSQETP